MVAHMPVIPNVFTTSDVASVQEYLSITGMADNGTWGNRRLCATLLHTPVYAYDTANMESVGRDDPWYILKSTLSIVLLGLKLFT